MKVLHIRLQSPRHAPDHVHHVQEEMRDRWSRQATWKDFTISRTYYLKHLLCDLSCTPSHSRSVRYWAPIKEPYAPSIHKGAMSKQDSVSTCTESYDHSVVPLQHTDTPRRSWSNQEPSAVTDNVGGAVHGMTCHAVVDGIINDPHMPHPPSSSPHASYNSFACLNRHASTLRDPQEAPRTSVELRMPQPLRRPPDVLSRTSTAPGPARMGPTPHTTTSAIPSTAGLSPLTTGQSTLPYGPHTTLHALSLSSTPSVTPGPATAGLVCHSTPPAVSNTAGAPIFPTQSPATSWPLRHHSRMPSKVSGPAAAGPTCHPAPPAVFNTAGVPSLATGLPAALHRSQLIRGPVRHSPYPTPAPPRNCAVPAQPLVSPAVSNTAGDPLSGTTTLDRIRNPVSTRSTARQSSPRPSVTIGPAIAGPMQRSATPAVSNAAGAHYLTPGSLLPVTALSP